MSTKTKNIINWVLAGLVGFIFLGSAYGKLSGGAEGIEMAKSIGIDANSYMMIGVVELISIILFLIPRTAVLGTLLLAAYMGGAISAHLGHGLPIGAPIGIAAFVWIVGVVRSPELLQRILGKTSN
jgi:DoxX-like family